MNETLLLVDTPNIGRGVLGAFGPDARPDYGALLAFAAALGAPVAALAFVNDGVKGSFIHRLTALGYTVCLSHARDVDELLVAKAVALHHRARNVVLASGDGGFSPLIDLFSDRGVSTFLAAIPSSCSSRLKNLARGFINMPVAHKWQLSGKAENRLSQIDVRELAGCQKLCVGEL